MQIEAIPYKANCEAKQVLDINGTTVFSVSREFFWHLPRAEDIFTATLLVLLYDKLYVNISSECDIISYATEKVFNSFQGIHLMLHLFSSFNYRVILLLALKH